MSNFKVGDWVYFPFNNGLEHVFKCSGLRDDIGCISSEKAEYWKENCHLLTPLEPGEAVERGTRCAVIAYHDFFRVGKIIEWDDFTDNPAPFAKDENNHCFVIRREKLARLPDCAQREPGADERSINQWYGTAPSETPRIPRMKNPPPWLPMVNTKTGTDCQILIDTVSMSRLISEVEHQTSNPDDGAVFIGDKKVGYLKSVGFPSKPTPCPHPEWEGVWVDTIDDIAYKIEWQNMNGLRRWAMHRLSDMTKKGVSIMFKDMDWSGLPDLLWIKLEPAPTTSTSGHKLPRPPKHGGVTVPWDPYGEG